MTAKELHFVHGFINQCGPDFFQSLKDFNLPLRTLRKKDGKIPRPTNSFLLFKKYVAEYAKKRELKFRYKDEQIILKSSQRYLTKVSSYLWEKLPIESKHIFIQKYEMVKYFHETDYPGYKYNPNRQAHSFKANERRRFKKSNPVEAQNSVAEESIPQIDILTQQNINQLNQLMAPPYDHVHFNDQYLGADFPILTDYIPSQSLFSNDTFTAKLPSQWLNSSCFEMYNNFTNEFAEFF